MSFDYRACFALGGTIDVDSFQSFLSSFGLSFMGATEGVVYEGSRVVSNGGSRLDLSQFIANANLATPSAESRLNGKDFWFVLSVSLLTVPTNDLRQSAATRVAWLEISDQSLYDMAFELEDRNADSLQLLVALFKALNARSMAMGLETRALQFAQFFSGELSVAHMDERIWTTIQPPVANHAALLDNPARKKLIVNDLTVVTGNFPGADDYFSSSPSGE